MRYRCLIQTSKRVWLLCLMGLPFWMGLGSQLTPASRVYGATIWTEPTAEELSMTSEPKAPGAPAIVLLYQETDDAETAEVTVHVRIKVLTDAGKAAGTIHIPNGIVWNDQLRQDFFARTIHRDGNIVPFESTEKNTVVVNDGNSQEKIFSLSGVETGSIVEYEYHFASQETPFSMLLQYYSPHWSVQNKYFIRSGHWVLKMPTELASDATRWVAKLPSGAALKRNKGRIELQVENVPAFPSEEYMPPPSSTFYNVRFFYFTQEPSKYWGITGGRMDDYWSPLYKSRKALVDVVQGMFAPNDNDEAKLRKIYHSVEQFENTDLTRELSEHEEKRQGLHKANNSEDVWGRKRGNSDELTLLFIALVRAAGYQAYPMEVSSRGHAVFDQNVLSWRQMDSMVAIVVVNGKEIFFDPGTRMCPYAKLAPWHSDVAGVSVEGKLVKIRATPIEPATSSRTERAVAVSLGPDGVIKGIGRLAWLGDAALGMRQKALRGDQKSVETELEREVQQKLPTGVQIKLESLKGLDDPDVPLVAMFSVSGTLGQATRRRIVVPTQFFANSDKPILVEETRSQPIAFPSAYIVADQMILRLKDGLTVEGLPKSEKIKLGTDDGSYAVSFGFPNQSTREVVTQRYEERKRTDFPVADYGALHAYYATVASANQKQIVLLLNDQAAKPQ